MPPLTPRRIRATGIALPAPARSRRLPVAVLDLSAGSLLERDRQVVLRRGLDHRRRELLEGALSEVVVVGVDLARPLGGDDHACVWGVDVLQQAVDAG